VSPEYEPCRRLAESHGLPLAEVYQIIAAEATALIDARSA
jgi:uncharacterized protein (DUF111 family)